MPTKAELTSEVKKLKKALSAVYNDVQRHCYLCCGCSLTEAKRCGMKPTYKGRTLVAGCTLYKYNPRNADKLRPLYS